MNRNKGKDMVMVFSILFGFVGLALFGFGMSGNTGQSVTQDNILALLGGLFIIAAFHNFCKALLKD